ncbi:hypothetical protein K1T71_011557 [Dendrolimus kikuchii]|uniref:Uncharacterized protein n=1 Tax=Dendrolimus kikuchii TaxID=765133 RepID=A0ACC1CPC8_9NEOP|nr:hypothetical protein K1T71_011557 [Dendrolimus kikuchii]
MSIVKVLLTTSFCPRLHEDYAKFPRLFHLDDYETCLSQPEGLYCLGIFHAQPLRKPDRIYELMEEYSKDPHHFNRTRLHRGYCVSARCPHIVEANSTLRLEKCAAQWGKSRALRLSLLNLQYCSTHAEEYARNHDPEQLDVPERLFLTVVSVLLALNFVGTMYDAVLSDDVKRNSYLAAWSLRCNWRKLTASYEDGDPRLQALLPVQGFRVLLLVLIIGTHSGCIHDMTYVYNPRFIERMAKHPNLMLFMNGTSVTQAFVVLSNFLLAYNVLLFSKTHQLSLKMLPYAIIKRISRITPVYLLLVGYAATWWPKLSSGPLWPMLVDSESAICRKKFWSHVLFINNLVSPQDICLVQTWFLAVDMQLYIFASALTLLLLNYRSKALRILITLFFASVLLNAGLAYAFEWKSLVFFVYPENLRTMYRGIGSFAHLYMSPWGSLPACFVGLIVAFLHHRAQEQGRKFNDNEAMTFIYNMGIPLIVSWIMAGNWAKAYTSPLFLAAYAALEKPLLSIMFGFMIFAIANQVGTWLREWFGWRGWHAMGRMSLSVLMVHWCINMALVASKPQPVVSSFIAACVDALATLAFSYLTAIPLTLMVEYPVQKTINALLF